MGEVVEMVEVKLQIPKAIISFLSKMQDMPVEEYMVQAIADDIRSSIEGGAFGPANLIETFSLLPVFKKYDLSVDPTILEDLGESPV